MHRLDCSPTVIHPPSELKLRHTCDLRRQCIACCYCIRKGLIRKAHFAYNMKKWTVKRPNSRLATAIPETYIMDVPDPEYIEEALYDTPEVPLVISWQSTFENGR